MKTDGFERKFIALNVFFILHISFSFAQLDVFISKPDINIQRVIALTRLAGSETDTARVFEYNRNGLLIQERVPSYYIFIDYRYDKNGLLMEKEALYGESFENGITSYLYNGDTTFEVSRLAVSFQKTIKVTDKQKKIIVEKTWYAAGLSGESFIESVTYDYLSSGQLNMVRYNRSYYDYGEMEDGYFEMEDEEIIRQIEASKKLRDNNKHTIFSYKKGLLVSSATYHSDSKQKLEETNYSYNGKGQILIKSNISYIYLKDIKEKPLPVNKVKFTIKNKYDKKGKLIEIQCINDDCKTVGTYQHDKLIKEVEVCKGKEKERSETFYQYIYY